MAIVYQTEVHMKSHYADKFVCFAIVSLCMFCAYETNAQGIVSDKGVGDNEIVRILSEVRKQNDVPAMAAALVTSQGMQKVGAVGTRKWGMDIPVTLNDMWHLGSDTKMMTSTLVAILVSQGKLKWATTVSDVFPDLVNTFHPDFRNVTLIQLLSHVAGLPANVDYAAISNSVAVRNQRIEAVRIALQQKPLSKPGSQYLYSNVGYVIVGAMIERVCNMDWETAVTQYVFTPLKMNSVGFGGIGTVGMVDQPWGHERANKPVPSNGPQVDNPPVLGPAGRVHCTIQDWALFIADQLRGARGEPALLKSDAYQMLQSVHFGGDYGLGWVIVEREWAGGKH
jgi:CubicO group peptidase (beta-lactamase class C family)